MIKLNIKKICQNKLIHSIKHNTLKKLAFIPVLITSIVLSSCSLLSNNTSSEHQVLLDTYPDIASRITQVTAIEQWIITGKVGFFEKKQKQSASFHWVVNIKDQQQQLNLTTFLGINVLRLESDQNNHVIEVLNKTYQGNNLTDMLSSIANINLPAQALNYWLRGIQYLPQDKITYNKLNHLPETLISYFEGERWQISYDQYQEIATKTPVDNFPSNSSVKVNANNSVALARKLVITQNDLTIKLTINQWNLL